MADGHDALEHEIKLALELAFELRLEDDPTAQDDALDLEVACNYWQRVLPAALSYLRKVERQLVALPLSGMAISRLVNKVLKQINTACCHAATFAQSSASPLFSEMGSKVMGTVASAVMVAAPVAVIAHAASASTAHLSATPAVHQTVQRAVVQMSSTDVNTAGLSSIGTSDQTYQLGAEPPSNFSNSQIVSLVPLAVTISQTAPTSQVVTTTSTASFADQLSVTGNDGAVTYIQSTGAPDLVVTSSGAISTSGILAVGDYSASGTDTDIYGDNGTWSYSLTVNPVTISQTSPISHSTTTTDSTSFTRQLAVAGNNGTVTYSQSTGSPDLVVTNSGTISTNGMLAVGTYSASGSDSDSYGDTGSWSFNLTVDPVPITQISPISHDTTTTDSFSFMRQLLVEGAHGAVTYTQSSGSPDLMISSSGGISTNGTLAAGNYSAIGTDTDTYGDTGTWSYSLTVNPVPIIQTSPTSVEATTSSTLSFTDQLGVMGSIGAVTFTQSTGSPDLVISSAGGISTSGILAAGTYTATGSDADAYGDTGTWSYSLTVNPVVISQTSPISLATTTTTSLGFTGQIGVTGNIGAVTFTQSTGSPDLVISSAGGISTSGILAAGTYTATGSDADAYGDTGTWSYSLTVNPVVISQTSPISLATTTTTSLGFTGQIGVAGNNGAVTFTQSTGSPDLVVSSTGAISTSGMLVAGTYSATGSDADAYGDTGTWSYSLVVNPVPITQSTPTSVETTTAESSSFTDALGVAGNNGPVTFTQSAGSPDLVVSSTGAISTSGILAAGTYTATGSDADAYGDTGTWTYSLTVNPVVILQSSPATHDTLTTCTLTFARQLGVTGNLSATSYSQSTGSPELVVSSTGAISTSGLLAVGTYSATGTDADAYGDTGTWSYTLTVDPVTITQSSSTSIETPATDISSFNDALGVAGNNGAVTFAQSAGSPDLVVSSTGAISTSGSLAPGIYTATGTDVDAYGDSGIWTYSLTVDPVASTDLCNGSGSSDFDT